MMASLGLAGGTLALSMIFNLKGSPLFSQKDKMPEAWGGSSNSVKAQIDPKDPYSRSRAKVPMGDDFVFLTGSSNRKLAESISKFLGVKLANCDLKTFADGETSIQVLDNVQNKDVIIV
mmetsp:Transcript_17573/g.29666  ORF Transcript_17573/g.29666 Transcript_17573/m.29666 type:complete len:119 (-) Transcript_17573:916-1272(-)